MVLAFPFVGYFAYVNYGVAGVRTAGVAAAICWLAATVALLVSGCLRNSPHAVAGILIASGLRFGPPLVSGITLQHSGGILAETGIFHWIVIFYLLTLFVDTALSVSLDRKQNQEDGKGIVTNG
ncbi:MAG: hypothetical protein HY000_17430 [Planctomycetes bacterium]|nr:hypothetical protein [Planctomycetota bacterium]